MMHSWTYRIPAYRTWNATIFAAILDFRDRFNVLPHICLTNENTANKIDIAMTTEIIENGLAEGFKTITVFSCNLTDLTFCVDLAAREDEFELVFDDEADVVEPVPEFFPAKPPSPKDFS